MAVGYSFIKEKQQHNDVGTDSELVVTAQDGAEGDLQPEKLIHTFLTFCNWKGSGMN